MATTSVLVPIMIKYGGEYISEVEFQNFIINEVLFNSDFTYDVFVVELYKQLSIDPTKGLLDIKYIVTARSMPIYNVMSVKLYMEMKKKSLDINEYPLCITLVPVEFTAGELSNDIQIHHISIEANRFSSIEDDFSEEHLEDEPKPIIMDPHHRDVEERQLYWDKNTITSVMKHYEIRYRFQFKVNRSSTSRYYLQCANKKCQWSFRSSSQKQSEVFMVTRFFDVHTCTIIDRMFLQRHATSLIIAKMVKNKYLNLKSSFTPVEITDEMRNIHGIRMNYKKHTEQKKRQFN
ncbi:hypothetical protein P3S68_013827 [Capsicum galapagoense]